MADFLGLAFVAGLLAFFAPCSVALVPAYIGLYLPKEAGGADGGPELPRAFVAALLGLVVASAALLVSLAHLAAPPEGGIPQGPWTWPAVAAAGSGAATAALAGATARAARDIPLGARAALVRGGARGAALGLVVSAGFVTVFGGVGLALAATQGAAADALPYVALGSAVVLLGLGAAMAAGRPLSVTLRVFAPARASWASSYLFGVGYAFVSTGCLLPVFLLVVSAALAAGAAGGLGGGLSSALVMVAYAAGYSVLMVALSMYVSVTRNATLGRLRALLPHIERVAGVAVVAAALYILWYGITWVLPSL
ncbi:MAG TPA: cytochrome c biogenesis protein CcdA [Candidatus Thermoplasmatota archaeon]